MITKPHFIEDCQVVVEIMGFIEMHEDQTCFFPELFKSDFVTGKISLELSSFLQLFFMR